MPPELGFKCIWKAFLKKLQEIVWDQNVIKSTFFIVHTYYILYFWLSVKTTMLPVLDSLKFPILQKVKKNWYRKDPEETKI